MRSSWLKSAKGKSNCVEMKCKEVGRGNVLSSSFQEETSCLKAARSQFRSVRCNDISSLQGSGFKENKTRNCSSLGTFSIVSVSAQLPKATWKHHAAD